MASCSLITTKELQTWTPMRTHIKRNGDKHASIHTNQNNIHEHCTCFSAVVSTCFIIASHFSFSSSTVCHVCFSSLQSSVTLSEHFFIMSSKCVSSAMRVVASGTVSCFPPENTKTSNDDIVWLDIRKKRVAELRVNFHE